MEKHTKSEFRPTIAVAVDEMARRSFGYGRWEARYWFIGPEQGQGRDENDSLGPRARAWRMLGGNEVVDCREFHRQIGVNDWHRDNPPLQRTWRRLILLLMAYLERPTDNESLRQYQRGEWGMLNGETCVIELSGLPANSFKTNRDRKLYRTERMMTVRQRMRDHKPALVIMYGLSARKQWSELAESSMVSGQIRGLRGTVLALAQHPVCRGHKSNDAYWIEFGERLRRWAEARS